MSPLACAPALALLAAGCAGPRAGEPLTAGAFRSTSPAPAATARAAPYDVQTVPPPSEVLTIAAESGVPQLSEGAGEAVEEPVLVDAKIGDINGHPIYASDFFDELFENRLRTEAAKLGRAAWADYIRKEVRDRLERIVRDRLILEEALAALTPQERQGLRFFVERYQDSLESRSRGSRARAERDARERRYASVAREAQGFGERILVDEQRRKWRRTFHVSPADVQRYYEQNYERFNPPSTARFRQIRVPAGDEGGMRSIADALDAGTPFSEVAALPANTYKPREGGLMDERQFDGAFADATFFGIDEMNLAARSLSPGEWAGPFPVGPSASAWLYLEETRTTAIPLYHAQLAIEALLFVDRFTEAQNRHIQGLIDRASVTDLEQMAARLVRIADERYYRGGAGGAAVPARAGGAPARAGADSE